MRETLRTFVATDRAKVHANIYTKSHANMFAKNHAKLLRKSFVRNLMEIFVEILVGNVGGNVCKQICQIARNLCKIDRIHFG